MTKITLNVDKSAWFNNSRDECAGLQISINVTEEDGSGHGYRIFGPKYIGDSKSIIKKVLTERDAKEIQSFLKMIE